MKILEQNLSFFQDWTHGYFTAKHYFKGEFKREMYVTFFDTKNKVGSYAYIFVTTKNILFFVNNLNNEKNVLFELEPSDRIEIIEQGNEYLKTVLNSVPHAETSMSIQTSLPINLLKLNESFVILMNIQPDMKYGSMVDMNFKTIYLIEKEYNENLSHFMQLTREILNNTSPDFSKSLPGISTTLSFVNIYGVIIGAILFVLTIVAAIIYDPANRLFVLFFAAIVLFILSKKK